MNQISKILFLPALANGASLDLYRPGDNVFIKVNSTVLDPAENSVDSSNESANINAT